MQETEAEVLARIERTRASMGETIDRIGDRVNPDRVQAEIKARAREQVRNAGETVKNKARSAINDMEHEMKDVGRGVWNAVRENPIPAGMIGVGLAWLVANGAGGSDHNDRYAPVAKRGYGQGHGDGSPGVGLEAASDARAGDGTEESGEGMKEKAVEVKDRAMEKAEHVMDEAREMGQRALRAERRVEHAVQDNPLAAGALVAALGFAAGLVIPGSRRENEMFGPSRDRMMDNAEDTVRRVGEKARDAAKETASEIARDAVDEVTGGGRNRERAGVSEPGR